MRNTRTFSNKEFDNIIKQNLIAEGISEAVFTYQVDTGRRYELYYSEAEFQKFVEEMKQVYPKHYKKYWGDKEAAENKGGLGGELVPKAGRYGLMPPKMASVASSSRFCYLALRDGTDVLIPNRTLTKDDVEFEKECKIFAESLAAPQLDAYIADAVCDIFIEAKCHEIFGSHKAEFRNKYWTRLAQIKEFAGALGEAEKKKDTFQLPLTLFGISKEKTRFDIKQFTCHLLGIAEANKGKKTKLVYLFFKPCTDDTVYSQWIEEVFEELKAEINAIFRCRTIADFCEEHNIELMAIAEESKVMERLTKDNTINLLDE